MNSREYNREYKIKQKKLAGSCHRLLSASPKKKYKNAQSKINAIVKEAKKKKYTILPFNFLDREGIYGTPYQIMKGLVIYKEVDGVEISYNPIWKDGLGVKVEL